METIMSILVNPITLIVLAFVLAIGFIASPYEIHFEDKDEVELD